MSEASLLWQLQQRVLFSGPTPPRAGIGPSVSLAWTWAGNTGVAVYAFSWRGESSDGQWRMDH
jgi:hypothetical protein